MLNERSLHGWCLLWLVLSQFFGLLGCGLDCLFTTRFFCLYQWGHLQWRGNTDYNTCEWVQSVLLRHFYLKALVGHFLASTLLSFFDWLFTYFMMLQRWYPIHWVLKTPFFLFMLRSPLTMLIYFNCLPLQQIKVPPSQGSLVFICIHSWVLCWPMFPCHWRCLSSVQMKHLVVNTETILPNNMENCDNVVLYWLYLNTGVK